MVAIEADISWHSDIVRFDIPRMLMFQCTMLQSAKISFAVVQTKLKISALQSMRSPLASVSVTNRLLHAYNMSLQAIVLVDSTFIGNLSDTS